MIKKLYNILPILLMIPLAIGIWTNIYVRTNMAYALIIITAIFLCLIFRKKLTAWANRLSPQTIKRTLIVGVVAIFVIQLFVLTFLPATVFHDPFRVLYQAELLAKGNYDWNTTTYFARYENNVPIAWLLSLWLRLTNVFHLSTNLSMHILAILFLDGFIILSLHMVNQFSKNNLFKLSYLFVLVFSSFSYTYYLQVVYTDLPLMFAILIVVDLLMNWQNLTKIKRIWAGVILLITTFFAQMLKGNFAIIAIAVLLTLGLSYFLDKKQAKLFWKPAIIIVLGICLASPVGKTISSAAHYQPDETYQLPIVHWVWMSYNPKTSGMYNSQDIAKMMSLKSADARTSYVKKDLPKRIGKLGFTGLLRQWYNKTVSFNLVKEIPGSYTAGYVQVPKFYINFQKIVSLWGQAILRIGTILLFGLSIFKLLLLFKNHGDPFNFVQCFSILTMVGFITFFVFIWEIEPRYSQIIIPLLLANAMIPAVKKAPEVKHGRTWLFGISVVAAIFAISLEHPSNFKQDLVIAAQRSQLSSQYHAPEPVFSGKDTITQDVRFNHAINELSCLAPSPSSSNMKLQLVDLSTNRVYDFKYGQDGYVIERWLPAGRYQLKVTPVDRTKKMQLVLTKMQNYKLGYYPLIVNGHHYQNQSMVYEASYTAY